MKIVDKNDVLVVLVKDTTDWLIVQQKGWYRIPTESRTPKNLMTAKWLSFYFPKKFGNEKYSIRYYAEIQEVTVVHRFELFPNEPTNSKSKKTYFKITIKNLSPLPRPIVSLKGRMLLFIPTTFEKLIHAEEINDIFNDSPLEDKLWQRFKAEKLTAERQYYVKANGKSYFCDFAIFCQTGVIDVECDGEQHQSERDTVIYDKVRNNEMEAVVNFDVLRFTNQHINYEMDWTLSIIKQKIDKLGGIFNVAENRYQYVSRNNQLGLFD